MAYAPTTNPPALLSQLLGSGVKIFAYSSSDPAATVDTTEYFSDGWDLGIRAGHLVIVTDTANQLVTMHNVITAVSTAVNLGTGTTIGSSGNSD